MLTIIVWISVMLFSLQVFAIFLKYSSKFLRYNIHTPNTNYFSIWSSHKTEWCNPIPRLLAGLRFRCLCKFKVYRSLEIFILGLLSPHRLRVFLCESLDRLNQSFLHQWLRSVCNLKWLWPFWLCYIINQMHNIYPSKI